MSFGLGGVEEVFLGVRKLASATVLSYEDNRSSKLRHHDSNLGTRSYLSSLYCGILSRE